MSATNAPRPAPLTVLVDDVRGFRDERPALVARSSQEALSITAVVHQANIGVGERGTEAAAATGAPMAASSSVPVDLVSLTVDRPFLFALQDLDSGAVLFLGRIADPSVGAPKS